jgi:hypothetical protein
MANEVPHQVPHINLNKNKLSISDKEIITWLEKEVKDQPKYDTFANSRGKILQNEDVAANWEFATRFVNTYIGKPSEVQVCHNLLIYNHS